MADFTAAYVIPLAIIVGQILAIVVPLLVLVAMLTWFERKVMAAMQLRLGPNVVGPFGTAATVCGRLKTVSQRDGHTLGGE